MLALTATAATATPQAVTSQPEGTAMTARRSCTELTTVMGKVTQREVTTDASVVVNGPDVYFKDYISSLDGDEVWLHGTLDGQTLTVTLPQVAYVSGDTQYCAYALDADYAVSATQAVTFKYVGDAITQTDGLTVGLCDAGADGKPQFMGYGVKNAAYTSLARVAQTLPAGLATEKWAMTYALGGQFVDVAVDGDKVWIAGLVRQLPDCAIMGTIEGDAVVFDREQYLGVYDSGYMQFDIYFMPMYFNPTPTGYDDAYQFMDQLEMSWDPEARVMASEPDQGFDTNAGLESIMYLGMYQGIRIFEQGQDDIAMTPSAPYGVNVRENAEENWDKYGFASLGFTLPFTSVNGDLLNVAKLYYEIYIDDDDPVVFDPSDYTGLKEPAEMLPAAYGDDDFSANGSAHYVCLWFTGYDRIGVQSIYTGGGEERRSPIVYNDGTVAIEQTCAGVAATDSEPAYFDLTGRRVARPQGGVFIKVQGGKATKVVK